MEKKKFRKAQENVRREFYGNHPTHEGSPLVIDTSIAIKWFLDEEGSDQARTLLKTESLEAPDLLLYELTNVLTCKPGLSEAAIESFLKTLFSFKIQFFVLPQHQFFRIVQLSKTYKLTSYDASFIALAETLKLDLMTADRKLVNKVKNLPFVRALT